jgi:hypothetical protein
MDRIFEEGLIELQAERKKEGGSKPKTLCHAFAAFSLLWATLVKFVLHGGNINFSAPNEE